MKSALLRSTLGLLIAGAFIAPGVAAQACDCFTTQCPDYVCAVNQTAEPYVVSPLAANCLENYHLFIPAGTKPATGWPVLIHLDLADFEKTKEINKLPLPGEPNYDFLREVLDQGIAVVTARATASTDDACGLGSIPGDGTFHPPGYACAPGLKPYDTPEYSMAEKDAAMLIQHVRFNAGNPIHLLKDVDRHRIIVHGSSSGAAALMWATLGRERCGSPPFSTLAAMGGDQYTMPTRPDAAVLRNGIVWWPHMLATPTDPDTYKFQHFANMGECDSAPHHLDTVDPVELKGASALYYEEGMLNTSLPILLTYEKPSTDCTVYTKTPSPLGCSDTYPFAFHTCGPFEMNGHAAWSGYVLHLLYPNNTSLGISNFDAYNQGPEYGHYFLIGEPDDTPEEARAAEDAIVVSHIVSVVPDIPAPWRTIVQAKPNNIDCEQPVPVGVGALYPPILSGSGSLQPGTQVTLTLNAAANASVDLIRGVSPVGQDNGHPNIPSYGGIIVPRMQQVVHLTTSPAGSVTYGFVLDAFPPFTKLYFQAKVMDASAPQGFALSNALQATVY